MRPTPRLALVVFVAAAAVTVASFWDLGGELAAAAVGLLVPVGLDLVALLRRPRPAIERPGRTRGSLRRDLELPIMVRGAVGPVAVALDWPHTLGGPVPEAFAAASAGALQVAFRAVPRRRGAHEIGEAWLRVLSPLHLWSRRFRQSDATRVDVWPDLRGPSNDILGREVEGEGAATAWGLRQAGSDLRGLRPFQSGDDPRHVDWKATARHGGPVVREWQPDRRRAVIVALDAGRLMRAEHDGESKFDAALRALARLALAAEARGDRVGVVAFANKVLRWVPPLYGAGQAERLLRYLGDLEPVSIESDLGRAAPQILAAGRRTLVVVVSDVMDAAGANGLVAAVAQIAERHVPAVALLRDPHLDAAFARPVKRTEDGFHRAAAELVARQRCDALDLLRARGVWAFDLSMRAIAFRIVQAYLDARAIGKW
jgi:uncharacterized protein (DUF58 family)